MAPFLPFAADKCLNMLQLHGEALTWDRATEDLPPGAALGKAELLFKKLDPDQVFAD